MADAGYYGGQALVEGVMIRGAGGMSVACRRPDGQIVVRTRGLGGQIVNPSRKLPLVRGVVALADTFTLGMRALAFSANVQRQAQREDGGEAELSDTVFWGSIAIAVAFLGGVFFAGPGLIAGLLSFIHADRVVLVTVEGVLRLGMLIGYIVLIGRLPDVRRVFQYHGAEHMAVHAHEAGQPLTLASVRAFPKEHTRCGTSFLLVVMLTAFAVFFAFDLLVDAGLLVRLASRVVLLLPIAAVSYEMLRAGARFGGRAFVRALFVPNLALQALTTLPPDDDQIEVAITAMAAILAFVPAAVVAPASVELDAVPA